MVRTVFLSFTQSDDHIARTLAHGLEEEGFDVFYASETLEAGQSFGRIFDEIDRRDAFVVLMSKESKSSSWVAKETSLAISRQAGGRALLIVPIYIDLQEPHHWLADVKGVRCSASNVADVLPQLVTTLREGTPPRVGTGFENFVRDLVRIRADAFSKIWAAKAISRSVLGNCRIGSGMDEDGDAEIMSRALRAAKEALADSSATAEEEKRVLSALETGREPPVVNEEHATELRRWARNADELHLKLALYLNEASLRYHVGTTLSEFVDNAERLIRDQIPDEDLRRWRCEMLFEECHKLGLLARSDERPTTLDQVVAELRDPGASWGPMLNIVAPLVGAFFSAQTDVVSLKSDDAER